MTVIDCTGDGLARGRAHGEAARAAIGTAIEAWAKATLPDASGDIVDYARGLVARTGLLAAMGRHMPDLLAEIGGIAEGAGQPFDLVAALNLMDEQWWYDLRRASPKDDGPGCSLLACPDGNGMVLAQTMDLPAFMDGSQLILRLRPDQGPSSVVLSSAGMIGLVGVNAAGVAVCVNTLLMLRHNANGVPVAAVVRHLLAQPTAAAARAALLVLPHASGQHYAVADRSGVTGHECSAAGCAPVALAQGGALLHTNHPVASADLDTKAMELLEEFGSNDRSRERLGKLTDWAAAVGPLPELFRTAPVCVRPQGRHNGQTFGAVQFRLADRVTASLCTGRPDLTLWQDVALPA